MTRLVQFALVLGVFAMACAGCRTTSTIETGMAHPSLEIVGSSVRLGGKLVSPWDVPDILEQHGVSHDTVVHIRINELDRLNEAQAFRRLLAMRGYRRTALVTKEHAESMVGRYEPPPAVPHQQAPKPAATRPPNGRPAQTTRPYKGKML